MLSWISNMLDRICAVLVAILFMQMPMFIDQYSIRLSGHVDELNYQTQAIQQLAIKSNKSMNAYVEKFIRSTDIDFSNQGKFILDLEKRKEKLKHSLTSLTQANLFTRPFIFLFNSDWTIVHATCINYQVGISFTLESIIYALIGVFVGYYLYKLFSSFGRRIVNGFRRAKNREKPPIDH